MLRMFFKVHWISLCYECSSRCTGLVCVMNVLQGALGWFVLRVFFKVHWISLCYECSSRCTGLVCVKSVLQGALD